MKNKKTKEIFIPAPNAFGNFDIVFKPTGSFVLGQAEPKSFRKAKEKHDN